VPVLDGSLEADRYMRDREALGVDPRACRPQSAINLRAGTSSGGTHPRIARRLHDRHKRANAAVLVEIA